jgi:predicted nucleic acid-binding protein
VILADTSVWINHLRSPVARLVAKLESDNVLMHPLVIGELACGNLRNRREMLDLLGHLSPAPVATHDEALDFLERRRLMGRGIGIVDVHLLASTALASPALLWTHDRRLAGVAAELDLAWP